MARPSGGGRTVVIVAFDGVQLLDVTGPVEVFTTANHYGADYDVRVVSLTGDTVATSSGLVIGADGAPGTLPRRLGTVLVPGRRNWRSAVADNDLIALVTDLSARAKRVASVCAGAFVLAEAGVLDGRRAATHWELAAQLAAAYPRVRVDGHPVFVRDGHVATSAGITAGIDLSLSLVEEDWGAEVARDVARQLVVFMARPGGQAQFSARLAPREPRHPAVRRVMDRVTADPAECHTLATLADSGGVSARHLERLFRTEVGMAPGRYVESVRVEAAQTLLADGTGTVEEVARQAGFGSSESLRRVFQHTLGVSPTVYRARFRSTLGDRTR
ncbi:AraC family transcriptional regulator [Streptomyces antioxidans]|uniref:AraC family transcriptional regulator n=1 Tax=Streptomyces antioxidans TaxID=1507734 RepID=A0A1V4D807_9ACTN|nr:GlxA family transcriptional regulator [Streptomyces antioxidans]OPF81062.1 AraC family transcriptional regulator [Streptomyces antioxidans]